MNPRAVLVCLIALAGIAVYLPGLTGGFAYDDYVNIVDNAALRLPDHSLDSVLDAAFSSTSGPLRRPVASLSFAAHYVWGDGGAMPFKLVNLAIHILNALLIRVLLSRILARVVGKPRAAGIAGVTALLWVVHPLNLTAVLYVVQRMTSLCATFVLLGMLAWSAARERMLAPVRKSPLLPLLACGLCGLLGIFTKETGALLVLYLLVLEVSVWRFERMQWLRSFAIAGAVVVLAMAASLLLMHPERFSEAHSGRWFTPEERLYTEFRVLVFYLGQILVPLRSTLSLFHDDFTLSTGLLAPPTTLLSLAFLVVGLTVATLARRRFPLVFLGSWWFITGHLLESTIVQLDLVYEHRNYLPAVGILAILADMLLALGRRAELRPAYLPGAVAIAFSALTLMRAVDWSDPVALTLAEARHNPRSQIAAYELGRVYHRLYEREHKPELRDRARAEFERAIDLGPDHFLPLTALAASHGADGELAPEALKTTLVRDMREGMPTDKRLYSVYALMQCQQHHHCRLDVDLILAVVGAALENPRLDNEARGRLLTWLGVYYVNALGDVDAALRVLRDAAARYPDRPDLRLVLVEALLVQKRYHEAAAEFARMPRPSGGWARLADRALRTRIVAVAAELQAAGQTMAR